MTAFYNIFDSEDPERPTFEDNFKMDLTIVLGHKSVRNMLDHLDAQEYNFFYEKYKNHMFGPDMVNRQLAQIAYFIHNSLGSSKTPFKDFIYRVADTEQDRMNAATEKMYFQMCIESAAAQGLKGDDIIAYAEDKTKNYMSNLLKTQAEELERDEI